jgi:transposase
MIPVLESFRNTYKIDNLIVIADAWLLSQKNIEALTTQGFSYILGARLKNMLEEITEKIRSLTFSDGRHSTINQQNNRLVISYSTKKAKKDAQNRERGLQRLEKALAKGKLTKQHINNRGYNKYLTITGQVDVAINYEKFHQDAKWDGLKGYLTNTGLEAEQVIENYNQLWLIEKAFRISKTDLRIRPIYHRLSHRIEAHIAISFCAYKIYKELERQLAEKKIRRGVSKVIEILNSIFAIEIRLPNSQQIATLPSKENSPTYYLIGGKIKIEMRGITDCLRFFRIFFRTTARPWS